MPVSAFHAAQAEEKATFVDWGGWKLPSKFSGTDQEVALVRNGVGYTDFAFLSHIVVRGPDALTYLHKLISRDLSRCPDGMARYFLALRDDGTVIEDGIVLKLAVDHFILSVACRNPLLAIKQPSFLELKLPKWWLIPSGGANVAVYELGAQHFSIQGPRSADLLRPLLDVSDLPSFGCREVHLNEIPAIISRTGYSGELGFDFLVWPEHAIELWNTIREIGRPYDARPYGVEATLILGLEKGLVMGHDFAPLVSPAQAGLAWAVDNPQCPRHIADSMPARLTGIELNLENRTPETNDKVMLGDRQVGHISASGRSPTLARVLARAWLAPDVPSGTAVDIVGRDQRATGVVCSTYRWYDPLSLKMRINLVDEAAAL